MVTFFELEFLTKFNELVMLKIKKTSQYKRMSILKSTCIKLSELKTFKKLHALSFDKVYLKVVKQRKAHEFNGNYLDN